MSRARPAGGLSSRRVLSKRGPPARECLQGQSAGSPGVALLEEDDLKKWLATDSRGIMAHQGLWEFPAARGDTDPDLSTVPPDGWPCVASGHGGRSQLSIAQQRRSSFSVNQVLLLLTLARSTLRRTDMGFLSISQLISVEWLFRSFPLTSWFSKRTPQDVCLPGQWTGDSRGDAFQAVKGRIRPQAVSFQDGARRDRTPGFLVLGSV